MSLKERGPLVGRIARAVRAYRGERQEAIAPRGGMTGAQLSLIETGRRQLRDPEPREALAKCLQVPVGVIDALLKDDPIPVVLVAAAFSVPPAIIEAAMIKPLARPEAA